MTERKKSFYILAALLVLLLLMFGRVLFTEKVIRAPDITAEFLWTVQHYKNMSFFDLFRITPEAGWDFLTNGGTSEGGGTLSLHFLYYRSLIFWLFPEPVNIAWFILVHLFFGAAGTYLCCRVAGCSRTGSLLGGLIFAVAPEIASLINAGHVQKIATISFAPWAFFFLEKGFITRRPLFFLATAVVLAVQFFNMHWQIAFYTCLALGAYGIIRSAGILVRQRQQRGKEAVRLIGLNLITLLFFLSTVAISLLPVADWSKESTRGVQSGANQGQGGLDVEEAMSWSLPPEELVTFVIPGFFGLSREEGGYNGDSIGAYYWGRMVFTQTTDYMGLLPLLLLPLPLIFRRDRYTWLALLGVTAGILFSFGKYTPFYWFLYEHFPGVNHFRVPKMMMFIPVLGMAFLSARGIDLLSDEKARSAGGFKRYLIGLSVLPVLLLAALGLQAMAEEWWLRVLGEMIAQPDRFQQGGELIARRWDNLVRETGIAAIVSAAYAAAIFSGVRMKRLTLLLPPLLIVLYIGDTWRVNEKFMLLQPLPHRESRGKSPLIDWLSARNNRQYRTLPMDGSDPMSYVSNGIPVFFTSNPVQMQRWQNYLENFIFDSPMTDIMNVRYIVLSKDQYEQQKSSFGTRLDPVYSAPSGQVILENRNVLPKAWLVQSVTVVDDPLRALERVGSPSFKPREMALVESPPPLPLAANGSGVTAGEVQIASYEANRITLTINAGGNSLLVLGEKYAKGWHAEVDGKSAEIYPVNYIQRGVYLEPGRHRIEFRFDPLPFKVGKYLTLASLLFFAGYLAYDIVRNRRRADVIVSPSDGENKDAS